MRIEVKHNPSAATVAIELAPGERLLAEPGCLMSMSAAVRLKTFLSRSWRPGQGRARALLAMLGGFFRAFWRKLWRGENAFLQLYEPRGEPGRVVLAPPLGGEIVRYSLGEEREGPLSQPLLFRSSCFLACSGGVRLEAVPRLPWLRASGRGELLLCGYGGLEALTVEGRYRLDAERLVALEPSLSYQLSPVPGRGAERVLELFGNGQLWVQTGSLPGLARGLLPRLG